MLENPPDAARLARRLGFGLLVAVLAAGACALPTGTDKTKKLLSKHGTIEAEWTIEDETTSKTHTYVLLRTKSGAFETYELVATPGDRTVLREQAGGIDGTGCFLYPHGLTTPWILRQPSATLEVTTMSGDKTRTRCLEYKEMAAWNFVPEADRKAAEPPPPPPPTPATSADAGAADAGTPDAGGVKSALPL